jgi:hypothetical protein
MRIIIAFLFFASVVLEIPALAIVAMWTGFIGGVL